MYILVRSLIYKLINHLILHLILKSNLRTELVEDKIPKEHFALYLIHQKWLPPPVCNIRLQHQMESSQQVEKPSRGAPRMDCVSVSKAPGATTLTFPVMEM